MLPGSMVAAMRGKCVERGYGLPSLHHTPAPHRCEATDAVRQACRPTVCLHSQPLSGMSRVSTGWGLARAGKLSGALSSGCVGRSCPDPGLGDKQSCPPARSSHGFFPEAGHRHVIVAFSWRGGYRAGDGALSRPRRLPCSWLLHGTLASRVSWTPTEGCPGTPAKSFPRPCPLWDRPAAGLRRPGFRCRGLSLVPAPRPAPRGPVVPEQ